MTLRRRISVGGLDACSALPFYLFPRHLSRKTWAGKPAAEGTKGVPESIAGVTRAAGEAAQAANMIHQAATGLAEQSATLKTEVERLLGRVRPA